MEQLRRRTPGLGLELTDAQLDLFQKYFEELIVWNGRFNLTAITAYEEVQEKHFLDSLTVSLALPQPIPGAFRLIDVGSGGGFPGIPLKIVFPQIEMVMIESTDKKADFLRHIVEVLSLEQVEIVCGRAEELAHAKEYREHFDAATARALAEMATLAELTLPFCRIEGRLIAQKKGDLSDEIAASKGAITKLGGGTPRIQPVCLPWFSDKRYLVVVDKLSSTPTEYPRRTGVPVKRPLS